MSYVNLAGINLKTKYGINLDHQINTSIKRYATGKGSNVRHLGNGGRKFDLQVLAKKDDIAKIQGLKNKRDPVVLVSASSADYNGKYMITELKQSEQSKNRFNVTISLMEHLEPNIQRKTFTNWQRPPSPPKPASTPSPTSYLAALNKCPTLKYGMRSECVKTLQKALKKCGHYTYVNGHYLMIDGYFGTYTRNSVKLFQKKKKIVQDGVVGPITKSKLGAC